jgi:HPt (histidine-containing phosphotransfer) domain-containing protein
MDRGGFSSKKRRTCGGCAQRSVNQFHDWLAKTARPKPAGSGNRVLLDRFLPVMPLHLERIEWMPSPPLAPDDGPIDSGHLERMTLGDADLTREVLAMFSAQAVTLIGNLGRNSADQGLPSDAPALAHTLKGSARAIGAFHVADAAEAVEAAIRNCDDPAEALAGLKDAVTEARAAIDALLRRS